MGTFDPVILPAGTARYVGSIRGGDEYGHDVFGIDVGSGERFGEVKAVFHSDGETYDATIVSFGFKNERNVGTGPGSVLPRREIEAARQTIVGWIEAVMRTPENNARPAVFYGGRHSGRIIFAEGWTRQG